MKAEDEMFLPLEMRSDSRDSRRLEGAPVRFLWTLESSDFSLENREKGEDKPTPLHAVITSQLDTKLRDICQTRSVPAGVEPAAQI